MSDSLLAVLDEQSAMGFTGKINVLRRDNAQSHAVILMFEGRIINCAATLRTGEKALLDVVFQDVSNSLALKMVVEPEVVTLDEGSFDWSVEKLKRRARDVYENYLGSKKLRPPGSLKLVLNPNFIVEGQEVAPNEFDVLSAISDYSRVEDIYNHCPLMEYEVTQALVSLRRKGALKVVAS